MKMAGNMMKTTTTKLYFENDRALTKITSMGGMSVIKMLVDKNGNSEMYMDVNMQKMLIKMTKEKAEEMAKDNSNMDPKYIHHKDKTKEILGLKAHLVEVTTNGDQKINMKLWVTDQIDTKAMVSQGMNNDEIGGFPLEYSITVPGQFTMVTKATEFKDSFNSSIFDFDKTGYNEMSMDDLKNMGMGGGGF